MTVWRIDVWGWFADPATWQGDDGVWHRLAEHSLLTIAAMLIAAAIGLPLSLWLGHLGKGGVLAINLSNVGRAIPVIALLSLLSLGFVGSDTLGPFGRAGLATLCPATDRDQHLYGNARRRPRFGRGSQGDGHVRAPSAHRR